MKLGPIMSMRDTRYDGIIVDNFAGGGGASEGIEQALLRPVDVAVNHDEAAIAVHMANHPETTHYCQSIYAVDPYDATEGRPVALIWFSPDCKHHSKAKGGKPRDKNIRDMAWVVPHWVQRLQRKAKGAGDPNWRKIVRVIILENVEEFRKWGPLDAHGKPIKAQEGEEFNAFVASLKRLGGKIEWRELRACDYGAPTSRKRLFMIIRFDGEAIVWPEPTHGNPASEAVQSGKLLPWRTAAECIDWSIPCPSIFDRKKDLKDATCRRIATGVVREVVRKKQPFFVPLTHAGGPGRVYPVDAPLPTITAAHRGEMAVVSSGVVPITHTKNGATAHPIDEPLRTITTAKGGELAATAASLIKLRNHSESEDLQAPLGTVTAGGLHHGIAVATMVQTGYGERAGQAPRVLDVEAPLGTVVAGGGKHGLVTAFLEKFSQNSRGRPATEPLDTVMAGAARHAVVCAHMAQHNAGKGCAQRAATDPVSTITVNGAQQQLVETTLIEADALPPEMMDRAVKVAAFLIKYYGNETGSHSVEEPLGTVTTRERFAVITVTIDATTYVIVDIGMRMLTPRELANATSFPPDYVLDPVCWYVTEKGNRKYGRLPKSHQIAKIGNAVCPVMSKALAGANVPRQAPERLAA